MLGQDAAVIWFFTLRGVRKLPWLERRAENRLLLKQIRKTLPRTTSQRQLTGRWGGREDGPASDGNPGDVFRMNIGQALRI